MVQGCYVRVYEGSRILCDEVHAGLPAGRARTARVLPCTTGVITTEGSVKHDRVVHEMLVNVAVACHVGCREAPVGGIGRLSCNVRRNLGVSREEPDRYIVRCPLHGVHTSPYTVEWCAKAVGSSVKNTAALRIRSGCRLRSSQMSVAERMWTTLLTSYAQSGA